MLSLKSLTVISGLITAVFAGQAHITNQCDKTVYLWSIDTEHDQSSPILLAPGGSYSEEYRKPAIGGVSIKLSFENVIKDPITQFEYTKGGNLDGFIWYDVSNVNCEGLDCPFAPYGFNFFSGAGCPAVTCKPGDASCAGVYNVWNDDHASLSCQIDQDITLNLCSGSSTGGGYTTSSTTATSSTATPTTSSTTTTPTSTSLSTYSARTLTTQTSSSSTSSATAAITEPATVDKSVTVADVPAVNNNVVVVTVTQVSTVRHYVRPTATAVHRRHRRHGSA